MFYLHSLDGATCVHHANLFTAVAYAEMLKG